MIELDVDPKPQAAVIEPGGPRRLLVLGDFGGRSTEPLIVDRDNLDEVLAKLAVNVGGLSMREIEDFHPDRLFERLEMGEKALEAASPSTVREVKPDIGELIRPASLLEQITEGGDPFDQYVRELARAHSAPQKGSNGDRVAALTARMNGLLHHPRFQTLEANWRGLDFCVRRADDYSSRIFVAQLSKNDLAREVGGATDLRTTRFHALVTGHAWDAVIGLWAFDGSSSDIDLLGRIALIAAAAETAFVAEGSVDMGSHWPELKSIPEAAHIGLALPRLLLRLPYGSKTSAIDSFAFEEMPAGAPDHASFLWGSSAIAVLTILARGGVHLNLDDLPAHTYQHDGDWKMTPCAEVYLTESQVFALMDMGLIPLVSYADAPRVRVAGLRAINGSELPLPA